MVFLLLQNYPLYIEEIHSKHLKLSISESRFMVEDGKNKEPIDLLIYKNRVFEGEKVVVVLF